MKAKRNKPYKRTKRSKPRQGTRSTTEGLITVPVSLLEAQLGPNPIIEEIRTTGRNILNLTNLNEREREFIREHPVDSFLGAFAALGAFVATAALFFGEESINSRRDAVRHCFFAAELFVLLDEQNAQTILDNHEFGRSDPFDNENNAVGRSIGLSRRNTGIGVFGLFADCLAAAEDGRLRFNVSPAPPLPPAPPVPPSPMPPPDREVIDDTRPERPDRPVEPQPRDREPTDNRDIEPIQPGTGGMPVLLSLRRTTSTKKRYTSQKTSGPRKKKA